MVTENPDADRFGVAVQCCRAHAIPGEGGRGGFGHLYRRIRRTGGAEGNVDILASVDLGKVDRATVGRCGKGGGRAGEGGDEVACNHILLGSGHIVHNLPTASQDIQFEDTRRPFEAAIGDIVAEAVDAFVVEFVGRCIGQEGFLHDPVIRNDQLDWHRGGIEHQVDQRAVGGLHRDGELRATIEDGLVIYRLSNPWGKDHIYVVGTVI